MIPLPLREVTTALRVSINGVQEGSVRGLSVDSRTVRAGDCFFPLDGDRVRISQQQMEGARRTVTSPIKSLTCPSRSSAKAAFSKAGS